MDYTLSEWLNLIVRWVHVFAGIMWVGTTYYFTWLDGRLHAAEHAAGSADRRVWMVHSGGFYTVEKQKTLGVAPADVHWFRWEAATTWASGVLLLAIVYYDGGAMLDSLDGTMTNGTAAVIGVATLIAGWIVYDLLAKSPLVRSEVAFAAVAFVLLVGAAYGLRALFSGRAAYIHVGGIMGTIMAANVWMRILPPQRRMIAAAARGETFDPALGAGAKQRSKHNTFMAVPVAVIMVSNHFPVATYGSAYSVAVLGALILAGWAAAAWIRRA